MTMYRSISHPALASSLLAALAACALTACALEEPAESTAQSASRPPQCSVFVCGDNAATGGDGLLFDEVNVLGVPNYAHVRLLGATLGSDPTKQLSLGFDHDHLFGIDQDGVEHRNYALKGTILQFRYEREDDIEDFEIKIVAYNKTTVRFEAGDPTFVPVYQLKARRQAIGMDDFDLFVCNHSVLPVDPAWAGMEHWAVMFGGDRYDPVQKKVTGTDPTSGWGFIGCAGNAGAKMHLYRHTYAGGFDDAGVERFATSKAKRTTMMKALTGDYCGNGSTFTENGTPLKLQANPAFAMPDVDMTLSDKGVRSYEALWSHVGVLCLDEPRRQRFGGPNRKRVMELCGITELAKCEDYAADWRSYSYLITGNPW